MFDQGRVKITLQPLSGLCQPFFLPLPPARWVLMLKNGPMIKARMPLKKTRYIHWSPCICEVEAGEAGVGI